MTRILAKEERGFSCNSLQSKGHPFKTILSPGPSDLPPGPGTKAASLRVVLTWGEPLPVQLSQAWKEATVDCRARILNPGASWVPSCVQLVPQGMDPGGKPRFFPSMMKLLAVREMWIVRVEGIMPCEILHAAQQGSSVPISSGVRAHLEVALTSPEASHACVLKGQTMVSPALA